MALLEQYPEYAMRTNKRTGERETKPWVSGPSPLALGLASFGLNILGRPQFDPHGWNKPTGGGRDTSGIASAGMAGLKTFMEGHRDLQGQRKDYYTHLTNLEDQAIQNQAAKRQEEEYIRLQKKRATRDKSFPELLKLLNKSERPEVRMTVPKLQLLYESNPSSAVNAASNIISQLKTKPGEIEYIPMTDKTGKSLGSSIIMQDGKYLATVKHSEAGGLPDKLDKKTYDGLLFKFNQPGDKTSADDYAQIYTGRQMLDYHLKDFTDLDKTTTKRYAPALKGVQTPWDKFLNHPDPALRLTAEEMTEKGWKKDPTVLDDVGTSVKPIPVTQQQSAFKIAGITGSEEDMDALFKEKGYDITKMSGKNILTFLAGGWKINPLSGPEYENARAYETHALKGSMSFAYLFSGATVRAEEMVQFRKSMYPMPGDNPELVESKRRARQRIIDLYNKMSPSSIRMAHALTKKANGGKLPPIDNAHIKGAGDNQSQEEILNKLQWE